MPLLGITRARKPRGHRRLPSTYVAYRQRRDANCKLGRFLYQFGGVGILGGPEDLIGFACLKQSALAHHPDAIADVANNGKVVAYENHCEAE